MTNKEIKFNNRQNNKHIVDGKEIWESRSAAVLGVLLFYNKDTNEAYVLLEKRSSIVTHSGKWCCPCGYMDWDENGWQAITREVYEETGFYIPKYIDHIAFDNDKHPFYINTEPNEHAQNIAISYGVFFEFEDTEFPWGITKFKNDEISQLKFVLIDDIKNYDIAFNHDDRINLFKKKVLSFISE